jgi:outer membrane biogenesis lipoprotein LolB
LTQTPSQSVAPPESPEVTSFLLNLRQVNTDLSTFKGTGKIKLWKKESVQVVRTAWTGARPDKIRIVIQGITGFPVASMAADGNWFYLLSYSQDSFYKAEVQNPDLEKLVSIPVTAGEIINLISGVVPIRQYHASTLMPLTNESGYVLSLMGEKGIGIEKIYLDPTRTHVHRIEMFTHKGQLAYRVDFNGETEVDGFRVPTRLIFSNDDGSGFQLDMDKFWPNAPVSPDMFVITPQG